MRLLGAMLIILASGAAGMLVAKNFAERPRILRALQSALQMLETEINYGRTTLPEACLRVAESHDATVSLFFTVFAQELTAGTGHSGQEAWRKALQTLADEGLQSGDLDRLQTLGAVIGQSDADDQVKHLRLVHKQLEQALHQAEEEREKNVRLWNYLGFCFGALVVLLLF